MLKGMTTSAVSPTGPSHDIVRLQAMIEDVRRIRTRNCEPKANTNPRYLALSNVVSNLTKAIDDMRRDL